MFGRRSPVRMITFSGTAGSGKSTSANHAATLLEEAGISVQSVRFQLLPCFRLLQKSFYAELMSLRREKPPVSEGAPDRQTSRAVKAKASKSYALRSLTLPVAGVYAMRICLFRIYFFLCLRGKTIVTDRYFYDNLAGYRLATKREMFYISVLRRLIRTPELPILLLGSSDVIHERRTHLPKEFIESKRGSWELIRQEFPAIEVVEIDDVSSVNESIEHLIAERLKESK